MTDTKMQIKIAEACGYDKRRAINSGLRFAWFKETERLSDWGDENITEGLPDCLNSLDAIQSAVLAQDEEFQDKFSQCLRDIGFRQESGKIYFHQLTARDWAEAFIETLKGLGRL